MEVRWTTGETVTAVGTKLVLTTVMQQTEFHAVHPEANTELTESTLPTKEG